MGIFVLYSVVTLPYYIGFDVKVSAEEHNVEILITILFGIDIILNFNTAYIDRDTEKLVVRRRAIAKQYLRGWFWVDILATIPFDSILQSLFDEHRKFALVRIIRVFRLIRLVKLYETVTRSSIWHETIQISPSIISLVILLMQIFYVTHIFACFWHYIALPASVGSYPTTWLLSFGLDSKPLRERYVASVYYVLITMITIGYGDIYPTNDLERLYGIMTILTGVIVMSAMVNRVTSVIANLNPVQRAIDSQMEDLRSRLLRLKLPFYLRKKATVSCQCFIIRWSVSYKEWTI